MPWAFAQQLAADVGHLVQGFVAVLSRRHQTATLYVGDLLGMAHPQHRVDQLTQFGVGQGFAPHLDACQLQGCDHGLLAKVVEHDRLLKTVDLNQSLDVRSRQHVQRIDAHQQHLGFGVHAGLAGVFQVLEDLCDLKGAVVPNQSTYARLDARRHAHAHDGHGHRCRADRFGPVQAVGCFLLLQQAVELPHLQLRNRADAVARFRQLFDDGGAQNVFIGVETVPPF